MIVPWSTQPITGAQHAAWMAEERERAAMPSWVKGPDFIVEWARAEDARIRAHALEWARKVGVESPAKR